MRLLSLGVLIALLACGSASNAPSTPSAPTIVVQPEVTGIHIGVLEAWAVRDGTITLENDTKTFGVGRPPGDIATLLASHGLPSSTIELSIQSLVVKANGKVLLFDAGAATASFARAGLLPKSLALIDLSPADITDIFISHAHADHALGLVANGALAFPSASIHLSAPEWAAMQKEAETDAETKHVVAVIAQKVVTFEPGAEIVPFVKAVATAGHTPGHSSYEVGEGTDKLFVLGDVAHHSVISVQRPQWDVQFDTDHAAANEVRARTLESLASSRTRVFAVHFPFPGIGYIERRGDRLVWVP